MYFSVHAFSSVGMELEKIVKKQKVILVNSCVFLDCPIHLFLPANNSPAGVSSALLS